MNRPSNIKKILGIMFTILGAVSLIVAIISTAYNLIKYDKADTVDATITIIERYEDEHYVFVSYTYDGEYYEDVRISFYSSSMYEGEHLELLVDPNNPGHVTSRAMMFLLLIPAIEGLIFLTIGSIFLAITFKAEKLKKNMLQNGMPIQATVETITRDYIVRYNGRYPFVLYCTYVNPSTGLMHRFCSEKYLQDLNQYFQPGMPVTVFVDPMDYSKYYVDVDMVINSRQFRKESGYCKGYL